VSRTILHVDLDAFFVAVEQARDPSLRGKPVIVGGDPSGRGVVATASYEARAFGVRSAMPLRTARRLAPHAIFLRGDGARYAQASRAFHAILRDFSPLVESGGLDEAYIDITGTEGLHGPPLAAADKIRARIRRQLGLPASVGIASGKLVAKVASDRAKPDGVLLVPSGQEAAFLAPMPLRALPMLGPAMERRLFQAGVSTLGQLASLPDATLRALFGRHGTEVARRARGEDSTPVAGGPSTAKSISREGTFAGDVAAPGQLRAVLRGFSESVAAQLRAAGLRARTVSLKLRFGDFTTISRSVTSREPLNSDDAVFALADRLLAAARGSDKRAVRLIGVGVSGLVPDAVQMRLEPGPSRRDEALSGTLDRIRRKYGRRSLQKGLTAFDAATGSPAWRHDPSTGLSSQLPAANREDLSLGP
jgi:DNA polymerase-4